MKENIRKRKNKLCMIAFVTYALVILMLILYAFLSQSSFEIMLKGSFIGFFLMLASSYAMTIWAYCCNRNNIEMKFTNWILEIYYYFIPILPGWVMVILLSIGSSDSFLVIPMILGCFIFCNFYAAVYFFFIQTFRSERFSLLICFVLNTMELIEVGFSPEVPAIGTYDVFNLFGGFKAVMQFESFSWVIKMAVIICLIYIVAITGKKKEGTIAKVD